MKYEKRLILKGTLLFLFLMFVLQVQGQHPFLNKVSPPEGVNWGALVGIVQDQKGFMWIATQNGLHRYDGYNFESYYHDPGDTNSLASNRTVSICISKSGAIWIGTFTSGLDRFDPVTKTFTHYSHDPEVKGSLDNNVIIALLEDREGTLWVGTHGGLHRFNPESGTFTLYRHNPADSTSLSNDQVRALYQDREGTLWVGTGSPFGIESGPGEGGLNRFHPETGTFTRYLHDPKDPTTLLDNKVRAIFEDSQGTFWVGTLGDGLHTMDRERGTFTRHRYDPRYPEKLSRSPNISGSILDGVTFIHEDVTGIIWIGTMGSGVSRYDPKTKQVVHYTKDGENPIGLQDNAVWWAHSSRDGVFWLGTFFVGELYRTDPLRLSFSYQPTDSRVWGMHEDSTGKVWVCTSNGLRIFDMNQEGIRKKSLEQSLPDRLKNEQVFTILEDQKGIMWIGTDEGLWRRDPKSGDFRLYVHKPDRKNSIGDGAVRALHQDRNKVLWVGTNNGGLSWLDTLTQSFTRYEKAPDTSSPSDNFVSTIFEDSQGNLWVGNWEGNGITKLNRKDGTFKRYLFRHSITVVEEGPNGRLWVGSYEHGLLVYDFQSDTFLRYFDKATGKPIFFNVMGIEEDDLGNLWVSSSDGLIKLDQEGNLIAMYGTEMGLKLNDLTYMATHKGKKGNLYIGDINGFHMFRPKEIRHNPNPPQVEFTNFRLLDKSVKAGEKGPLGVPLGLAQQIDLKYNQNLFAFDFTGIHFSNPLKNQYYYRLENYDDTWRHVKSEHTANYYMVPPGKYLFRVRVASSEGVWAEKSMRLIIHPPWWHTTWAYLGYGLLLAGGIFAVDRTQRRRIILRERERTRKRELAQARKMEQAYQELKRTQFQLIQSEKMASLGELTAGIAHEIQNPLNFVNNFSEVSSELVDELNEVFLKFPEKEKEEAEEILHNLKQNLVKIHHHGNRAVAIVKSMLQHSHNHHEKKELTDINSLAEEYIRFSYQGFLAKERSSHPQLSLKVARNPSLNVEIKTDLDPKVPKVNVNRQDLGRVMLNLLSNAFYAVREREQWDKKTETGLGSKKMGDSKPYAPAVKVSTKNFEHHIEIAVKDNGSGITDRIKGKIFQPFYTTKPTGKGTGLGLSLSYDIITKGHGGEIKVESQEGMFSEFIIKLPKFLPDEKDTEA